MAQPNINFENPEDFKLPTELAYERLLPEITAVPDEDLVTINIDVFSAITTATGCLPEIRGLRSSIEAEWRNFDFVQFDKLEQYTLALTHVHALYRSATAPKGHIVDIAQQLSVIRDQMIGSAQVLASHGLVDADRLTRLKQQTGYRALAADVLTLCALFREQWDQLAGKMPYTQTDLKRAGQLALELISAVGFREQSPVIVGAVALNRQRAFTLFVRAYDDARRAVHYLRTKVGDAETVAPSLYAGRAVRRRGDESAEAPEQEPSSDAPAATGAQTPAAEPPIVIRNGAGLPVDRPFVS